MSALADGSGSVRAIYDYEAQGADELSLQDGELIQLTEGPSGGRNYGDGWWEGESSSLRAGHHSPDGFPES